LISSKPYLGAHLRDFLTVFVPFLIVFLFYCFVKLKSLLKLNLVSVLLLLVSVFAIFELYLVISSDLMIVLKILCSLVLFSFVFFSLYCFKNNYFESSLFADIFASKKIIPIIVVVSFSGFALTFFLSTYPVLLLLVSLIILSGYLLYREKELPLLFAYSLLLICLMTVFIAEIIAVFYDDLNIIRIASYLYTYVLSIISVILCVFVYYSIQGLKNLSKDVYMVFVSLVLLPVFMFTVYFTYEKANKFVPIDNLIPALSGVNHLLVFHKDEYNSVQWLKSIADTKPVILEANKPGELFTGSVAAYSGISTVLGWYNDQLMAYGSNMENELQDRQSDIDYIYKEVDKSKVLNLIRKYNISYIYVGEVESSLYSRECLDNFITIADIAFQSNEHKVSRIYKLRGYSSYR
jgi:uncharacterized membrane protein